VLHNIHLPGRREDHLTILATGTGTPSDALRRVYASGDLRAARPLK
jgi:hypothetical protein